MAKRASQLLRNPIWSSLNLIRAYSIHSCRTVFQSLQLSMPFLMLEEVRMKPSCGSMAILRIPFVKRLYLYQTRGQVHKLLLADQEVVLSPIQSLS